MYPILFDYGGFVVPAWHTFFMLGALASYLYLQFKTHKLYPNIPDEFIGKLFIVGYLSAYFGSRIFSILIEQENINSASYFFGELFKFGSMTMYGGLTIGLVSCVLYTKTRKISIAKMADVGTVSALIGVAIGRIGCFLNGDDYGVALKTSHFWTVRFPNHSDDLARVPVQLFESFFCFLLAWLGNRYLKFIQSKFGIGMTALAMIGGYAFGRFFLEFLRGDPRGTLIFESISTSQTISIFFIVIILAILRFWKNKTISAG